MGSSIRGNSPAAFSPCPRESEMPASLPVCFLQRRGEPPATPANLAVSGRAHRGLAPYQGGPVRRSRTEMTRKVSEGVMGQAGRRASMDRGEWMGSLCNCIGSRDLSPHISIVSSSRSRRKTFLGQPDKVDHFVMTDTRTPAGGELLVLRYYSAHATHTCSDLRSWGPDGESGPDAILTPRPGMNRSRLVGFGRQSAERMRGRRSKCQDGLVRPGPGPGKNPKRGTVTCHGIH
ncbi:hypothetical protein B0T11DRAFT_280434 [Plectosphaerella cucumerina]|jgi:hypothetical protein|uniref:Uncharacterized protein n=1 Tax=Plectosphaerella cucumerina TaxID=40658 RepID=A0A8K0TCS3_9PEZI|nr:hypothetical protein B0T11DRAFT_280434 [Plectosphaerella cucumerina]